MANFIPPVNGASLGSYFCVKSHELAVFDAKTALAAKNAKTFSDGFWFCLDEISNNLL